MAIVIAVKEIYNSEGSRPVSLTREEHEKRKKGRALAVKRAKEEKEKEVAETEAQSVNCKPTSCFYRRYS